ncbi:ribosomal protein S16 domain-containing protein [Leptodontidium sp. 2 PMI_412]|nr:ribosomal protein S16 domain-containing protein [Leptodontidium sp. 2 PMI_412]
MVVKIRLARFGRRKAPFYNIVVAQARTARNSKPIEVLGTYDPIPKAPVDGEGKPFKDIKLDSARAKYWLGVGAQPSDPAWRLLSMAGLLEPKYRPKATS